MATFETEMTVGRAAASSRTIAQQEPPEPEEIPVPDGEGWQLISVIPVLYNEPYLQYFWQRDLDDDDDESGDGEMSPNVDINLKAD